MMEFPRRDSGDHSRSQPLSMQKGQSRRVTENRTRKRDGKFLEFVCRSWMSSCFAMICSRNACFLLVRAMHRDTHAQAPAQCMQCIPLHSQNAA